MKLTHIHAATVNLKSTVRNAFVSFSEMTGTIVKIVAESAHSKKRLSGLGFGSIGRYASTSIVNERIAPRLLSAAPEDYTDQSGALDPIRANAVMLRNEKPGGHGERSTAVGAVDMALWDLASKAAEMPLWRYLAQRFNSGNADNHVSVYAAGGYYQTEGLDALKREIEAYQDLGYTKYKIKIGGCSLSEDMSRICVAADAAGGAEKVAVDANGRFNQKTAHEYAAQLEQIGVRWFEEPGDPLDFGLQAQLSTAFPRLPFATGENLFSRQDVKNLIRYANLNPGQDTLQMDPALSYGLPEYLHILDLLNQNGWSPRRCVPHGGHQFSLHIAAAMQLGGNEAYPGVFAPFGGFADNSEIHNGQLTIPDTVGIGIEEKSDLFHLFSRIFGR